MVWKLAAEQHGVVSRRQLLELGYSPQAIDRRIANGRLHHVMRGIYAVGRPEVTPQGRWMAAILSCGPEAVLSHSSAAALWNIGSERPGQIEVTVRGFSPHRRPGICVHRRPSLRPEVFGVCDGVSVTDPTCTLIDLATRLGVAGLERSINEADKRDLIDPEALRIELEGYCGQVGVARLRTVLDRRTFTLTDSALERRFLPLARDAGLPPPLTQQRVNGFRVDFYWPDLGLIVETDGLRYHRTPAEQARDRGRDQAHTAAGLTALRFTRAQVYFEPDHVRTTLTAVARRLSGP